MTKLQWGHQCSTIMDHGLYYLKNNLNFAQVKFGVACHSQQFVSQVR